MPSFYSIKLITFASNLDPDQARQKVGPADQEFFEKLILKKIRRQQKTMKITLHAELMACEYAKSLKWI